MHWTHSTYISWSRIIPPLCLVLVSFFDPPPSAAAAEGADSLSAERQAWVLETADLEGDPGEGVEFHSSLPGSESSTATSRVALPDNPVAVTSWFLSQQRARAPPRLLLR
jgi:hypothetical protein